MKSKQNPSESNWAQLLSSALIQQPDKIPEGYKSLEQISVEQSICERTLRDKLPILVEQGKLTIGYFRVISSNNRTHKKPFWKISGK